MKQVLFNITLPVISGYMDVITEKYTGKLG